MFVDHLRFACSIILTDVIEKDFLLFRVLVEIFLQSLIADQLLLELIGLLCLDCLVI